jgi:hypothetical protein
LADQPTAAPSFFFDPDALDALVSQHVSTYRSAAPFPHAIIDGLLPDAVARRLEAEFPRPDFDGYRQPDNAYQVNKLGRLQDTQFRGVPAFSRNFLNELNGMVFLDFLEKLTGIKGLVPDPHFSGGAMHQILPGGRLAVHADFNRDVRRSLERRINVLFYLNPVWEEPYGGYLELWEPDMSRCRVKVAPLLNRCVVFNTTSTSFHGHPDPLCCPEGMTRKSIATYYYTSIQTTKAAHGTLWQERPVERDPLGAGKLESLARRWAPPALLALARAAGQRLRR